MLQAAYTKEVEGARAAIYKMVEGTMSTFACLRARSFFILRSSCERGALATSPRAMRSGAAQFLQVKDHREEAVASDGFAIKVNVAQVAGTDPSVKGLIEKIEDKRATAEKSVFEQVNFPLGRVAAVVLFAGAERLAQKCKV